MKEDYIPHKDLEEPSNIIEKSKKLSNSIFHNIDNKYTNLKQQIKDRNKFFNDLNNEIEIENKDIENSDNYIENDIENTKLTIYQKLALTSNQLSKIKEKNNILIQENLSLKNIISNKDKIISDFQELSFQFKEKFEKLELININLKNQLKIKNNEILKNIDGNSLHDNYYNNLDKNNINDSYDNNTNYLDFNEQKNKDGNYDYNINLRNKNNELINYINTIKKDIDLIESDYQLKLEERDCYIEQLNCEIINIYKEYVKLSDILEELNYLVKNSNYNELKTEFNCLLREKEILLKEKEKNHMEIMSLREKFLNNSYGFRNPEKFEKNDYKELLNEFNQKEKNFINEIESLKCELIERIKENEELKKNQENIIRDYELKIESLLKN